MSRNNFLRWMTYVIELVLLYLIHSTPGLIPEIFGARPGLLIPAAIMIAMFEGDTGGMVIGILSGLLIDLSGGSVLGVHAILLGVLCYFIGLSTMDLIKTNFFTALLFGAVSILLVCLIQWFLFYVVWNYGNNSYALVRHYLPKSAYTFCVVPLLYFFNRFFALRLSDS